MKLARLQVHHLESALAGLERLHAVFLLLPSFEKGTAPCMPFLVRSGLSRCAFATRRCTARLPARLRTTCFAAADKQRADLLKGVAPDNRIAVSRALEQAERAAAQWVVAFSDFLAPPAAAEALQCIERLSGVSGLPWGGYVQVLFGCAQLVLRHRSNYVSVLSGAQKLLPEARVGPIAV